MTKNIEQEKSNGIDNQLLKQYADFFDKEKEKNYEENKKNIENVLKKFKEQEVKLNKGEIKEGELLNILVYIYRYIFGKQMKIGLVKRIREIKLLLEDLIFILTRNQEKIDKYISQNIQSEIKISIMGEEVKGKAIDLEEINKEKLYYCHYLLDELAIINSITDGLEQVIDNIFNNELFYSKVEHILYEISSFTIELYVDIEKDDKKKQEGDEGTEKVLKKIVLNNVVIKIYNDTKDKLKEFIAEYKRKLSFDMNIKNIIDYMNRYMKFKDVLEPYYNKLYNKITEYDMEFDFYIDLTK